MLYQTVQNPVKFLSKSVKKSPCRIVNTQQRLYCFLYAIFSLRLTWKAVLSNCKANLGVVGLWLVPVPVVCQYIIEAVDIHQLRVVFSLAYLISIHERFVLPEI